MMCIMPFSGMSFHYLIYPLTAADRCLSNGKLSVKINEGRVGESIPFPRQEVAPGRLKTEPRGHLANHHCVAKGGRRASSSEEAATSDNKERVLQLPSNVETYFRSRWGQVRGSVFLIERKKEVSTISKIGYFAKAPENDEKGAKFVGRTRLTHRSEASCVETGVAKQRHLEEEVVGSHFLNRVAFSNRGGWRRRSSFPVALRERWRRGIGILIYTRINKI